MFGNPQLYHFQQSKQETEIQNIKCLYLTLKFKSVHRSSISQLPDLFTRIHQENLLHDTIHDEEVSAKTFQCGNERRALASVWYIDSQKICINHFAAFITLSSPLHGALLLRSCSVLLIFHSPLISYYSRVMSQQVLIIMNNIKAIYLQSEFVDAQTSSPYSSSERTN